MTKITRFAILLVLITLLFGLPLGTSAQAGDCDGTPGDDEINCTSDPTTPDAYISGGLGTDFIRLESGISADYVSGDALPGEVEHPANTDGFDDYITIDGTTNMSVSGDDVTGNGGNDYIIVSETGSAQTVIGDSADGLGGVDVINNYGMISDAIYGDYSSLAGAGDYIENHGTVGIIYGDHGDWQGQPAGGDDAIVNIGIVTNDINGESGNDYIFNDGEVGGSILTGSGDDEVVIQPNTTGGGDNALTIDGGADTDTVKFMWVFSSQAEETQFQNTIDSANPANATIIINGQMFTIVNFETITYQTEVVATFACSDGTVNDDLDLICASDPASPTSFNTFVGELGSDMMIIMPGTRLSSGAIGDVSASGSINSTGGDDIIINFGIVSDLYSDGEVTNSGQDIITNYGVVSELFADRGINFTDPANDDTILNYGVIDIIYGDNNQIGQQDFIQNDGIVTHTMRGDYYNFNEAVGDDDIIVNNGRIFLGGIGAGGGGDKIINNGFIGAPSQAFLESPTLLDIEAYSGDDTVYITENSRGGADYELTVDGGEGTDTLIFTMPDDSSPAYTQLLADIASANPANGSITYNGETVVFTNFEAMQIGEEPGFCPDGTSANDTIVCEVSPPVGSNTDANVDGGAGEDHITVNVGVTVNELNGDLPLVFESSVQTPTGQNDTLINDGTIVESIRGDVVYDANGGNDTIINNGLVANDANSDSGNVFDNGSVIGDFMVTLSDQPNIIGGDDQITNDGVIRGVIFGDVGAILYDATATGGSDTITNNGTIEFPNNFQQSNVPLIMGSIIGDSVWHNGAGDIILNTGTIANAIIGDEAVDNAGNDTITNTGTVGTSIYGDIMYDNEDDFRAWLHNAGQDTITNSGTVTNNIYGDYIEAETGTIDTNTGLRPSTGEGASDTITNSGTVGGTIFAEGGDDTVILQDGANGGDDNTLPLDGGDGTDTLNFDFTALTQIEIDAINASNPANGSVSIGGQTFTFVDFETITYSNYVAPALTQIAPIGTIADAYGNPAYSWTYTGADNYELYVARIDNTKTINPTVAAASACNQTTCEIDLTTLDEANRLRNGAHQWYMREAGGTWVGPMNFTLNAPPPGLVTLETTTNLDDLSPTFNWSLTGDAINATYFNLYLVNASGAALVNSWFTRAETCGNVDGTDCSLLSPVALTNGTSYDLYIQSYGPGGLMTIGGANNNGYAGPETFTINAPVPDQIAPIGTVDFPAGNPVYTWDDIAGAEYYYLYVANSAGTQIINEVVSDVGYCNGTTCQLDATTLRDTYRLSNGTYTWYIRSWRNDQATPWSAGYCIREQLIIRGVLARMPECAEVVG